jgi:hypothetical protein
VKDEGAATDLAKTEGSLKIEWATFEENAGFLPTIKPARMPSVWIVFEGYMRYSNLRSSTSILLDNLIRYRDLPSNEINVLCIAIARNDTSLN